MRIIRVLPLALFAMATLLSAGQPDSGWIALFDGKSLDGWRVACKPADRGKDFWTVRDGVITCDSRGRKDHDYFWLIYGSAPGGGSASGGGNASGGQGEFGDFELELKVRGFRESTGNSGLQFRSRYDEEAGWLDGPQMDIHPPLPWRTGLIYDETRGTRRWIYPSLPSARIEESSGPKKWAWKYSDEGDGWNAIRITCRGTAVKTEVNGFTITDTDFAGILDDEGHRARNVGLRGHFALQLHSRDELYIQYKDIRVRVLK